MTASFLPAELDGSPGRQATLARCPLIRALLLASVLLAAAPVCGGVVFREVELVEGASAGAVRQMREVLAEGEACKIIIEQSSDPLEPAGSYFLVTRDGTFFIDPGRATLAPVVPADMHRMDRPLGAPVIGTGVEAVRVVREVDEPGPRMFGLPTVHYVYLLRYEQVAEDSGFTGPVEERHEFWATALPDSGPGLLAWRERRINEDAGTGAARAGIHDAVARMHEHGFLLRQIIERRDLRQPAAAGQPSVERIVREITQISREDIPQEAFRKPTGLADTEFLAPAPDEQGESAAEHEGHDSPGDATGPAKGEASTGE